MLRIRYWRQKRGLTLKQLQELTGIPISMLSLYELGKANPPTSRIIAISTALDVPIGLLYPRKRPPLTILPIDDPDPMPVGVEGD